MVRLQCRPQRAGAHTAGGGVGLDDWTKPFFQHDGAGGPGDGPPNCARARGIVTI
jgi:hypothetical protein